MPVQPESRPSDILRPHVRVARQVVSLALGRSESADALVADAVKDLLNLNDLAQSDMLVLSFYSFVVNRVTALARQATPVQLIGQIPLNTKSAATGMLALDVDARIAILLDQLVGFDAEDAAFAATVQPEEHRQHVERAFRCLERILKN